MSGSCLSYVARQRQEERRQAAQFQGLWLALGAGVLAASALLSIRDQSQVIVPLLELPLPGLCAFREALGMDCPGCGLTRSFVSLAHGDLRAAWEFNPAGVLLFAAAAFQIPYRSLQLWRLWRGMAPLQAAALYWILLAIPLLMIVRWLTLAAQTIL